MSRMIFPVLAFVLFAAPARAETPLTLQQVFGHVYKDNPAILAARYSLDAVREEYPQAKAGWLPRLSAETSIISTDIESGNFSAGDGATTKGASVNVEQALFRGFRTKAEMEGAAQRIAAEEARVAQVQQDVFVRTAQSYMDVIRDRMLLSLQQKNKSILEKERESVLARFEAGDITKTDVRQTEARYSNAVADDAIAQSALHESEAAFEEVTGLWPPDSMEMPPIPFDFPQSQKALIDAAAENNPALSRSRREHEAAQSDITAAQSDFYPQVSAFAAHVKEYDPQPGIVDETESSTIGLRARISLYEGGNTLSRVREAKSRANRRFVEIIGTERTIKGDLIAAWRKLQAFDVEIAARELEVSAARFSADGVREEARLGERTVLDTLEAEQEMLEAESNLVKARYERVLTAYRLAAALGYLTAERLKTDIHE